jgi:hypothetical protein
MKILINKYMIIRSNTKVYVQPGRTSIHSFFVSDTLRRDLYEKNTLILKGTSLEGTGEGGRGRWN